MCVRSLHVHDEDQDGRVHAGKRACCVPDASWLSRFGLKSRLLTAARCASRRARRPLSPARSPACASVCRALPWCQRGKRRVGTETPSTRQYPSRGRARRRLRRHRSPGRRPALPWCPRARPPLQTASIAGLEGGPAHGRETHKDGHAPRPVHARRCTRAGTAKLTIGSSAGAAAPDSATSVGRLKISIRACVSNDASSAPAAVPGFRTSKPRPNTRTSRTQE